MSHESRLFLCRLLRVVYLGCRVAGAARLDGLCDQAGQCRPGQSHQWDSIGLNVRIGTFLVYSQNLPEDRNSCLKWQKKKSGNEFHFGACCSYGGVMRPVPVRIWRYFQLRLLFVTDNFLPHSDRILASTYFIWNILRIHSSSKTDHQKYFSFSSDLYVFPSFDVVQIIRPPMFPCSVSLEFSILFKILTHLWGRRRGRLHKMKMRIFRRSLGTGT